jgi:hypothetical protein
VSDACVPQAVCAAAYLPFSKNSGWKYSRETLKTSPGAAAGMGSMKSSGSFWKAEARRGTSCTP